jgi:hypothetical protein
MYTVSQLVQDLQQIITSHGDIPVVVHETGIADVNPPYWAPILSVGVQQLLADNEVDSTPAATITIPTSGWCALDPERFSSKKYLGL